MNVDTITRIFKIFSDCDTSIDYSDIIQSAIDDITAILLDSSYSTDNRLNAVCGSLANLRYQQFMSSRDRLNYTYAGTVSQQHDGKQQLEDAYGLFYSYLFGVKDLVKDAEFFFSTV